jgi:hypothetical protein
MDWEEIDLLDHRQFSELIELISLNTRKLAGGPAGGVERNLRSVASFFELDSTDAAIVGAIVRHGTGKPWELLPRKRSDCLRVRGIAATLGLAPRLVDERLRRGAKLCRTGLVLVNRDGDIEAICELVAGVSALLARGIGHRLSAYGSGRSWARTRRLRSSPPGGAVRVPPSGRREGQRGKGCPRVVLRTSRHQQDRTGEGHLRITWGAPVCRRRG